MSEQAVMQRVQSLPVFSVDSMQEHGAACYLAPSSF